MRRLGSILVAIALFGLVSGVVFLDRAEAHGGAGGGDVADVAQTSIGAVAQTSSGSDVPQLAGGAQSSGEFRLYVSEVRVVFGFNR